MDSNHKNHKKNKCDGVPLCNVFVIGVDGSEGSHNAVELVVNDLLRKGLDKMIVVHITDSKKDELRGLQYHSKTIYNKYHEYLASNLSEDTYEIIFEEKREGSSNVFEQINEIAQVKGATLLLLGFRGWKGTKNRPDELTKSVTYLVHQPKIPVLIVKEKTSRQFRPGGKFKWLLCLESAESNSYNNFIGILRFVDSANDIVHGIHVESQGREEEGHPVKRVFQEKMREFEIAHYDFSLIPRDDKSKEIPDLINGWVEENLKNENHFIDFIVLGYNPTKYLFNKGVPNTTVDILKKTTVNVSFAH